MTWHVLTNSFVWFCLLSAHGPGWKIWLILEMKVIYYSLSRPPSNLTANKDYFNNHFLDNHLAHKTCENSQRFCFEKWVSHFLMIASEINQELISALLLIWLTILEKDVFFYYSDTCTLLLQNNRYCSNTGVWKCFKGLGFIHWNNVWLSDEWTRSLSLTCLLDSNMKLQTGDNMRQEETLLYRFICHLSVYNVQ